MKRPILFFVCLLLGSVILVFVACDHGLNPEEDELIPGIDGRVTLSEPWEQTNDIQELYIVIFKSIPQDSDEAISQFLRGEIKLHQLTPSYQQEYTYSINLDPGEYEVTACVGIKGDNLFDVSNWVLSGVYTETNNPLNPTMITITEGSRLPDIDIQASVIYTIPLTF